MDKKAPVIDLNEGADAMLTHAHRWREVHAGHSVAQLTRDQLVADAGCFHFGFDAAVHREVSNAH